MKIRKQGNDEGAVAVEAAIVFPVLILLIMGLVGFGLVLNAYQSINHAAYEGARYAALGQDDSTVASRVNATVGDIAQVTGVTSPGCSEGENSAAEVTVEATVNAVFFDLDISATGIEKCAI